MITWNRKLESPEPGSVRPRECARVAACTGAAPDILELLPCQNFFERIHRD